MTTTVPSGEEEDVDVLSSKADLIADSLVVLPPNVPMTPHQLLFLGSVWYLSAEQYQHNKQQQQQSQSTKDSIVKPKRLALANATLPLQEGDYLRIHHTPRRFPQVYQADWSMGGEASEAIPDFIDITTTPPVVVVQQGPGYCIIDKPPLIPVHSTVDNAVENVVYQLQRARRQQQLQTGDDDNSYMAPVQRIDTNTSGLLVVATTPEFAAYFAKLLRHKTKNRDEAIQQHQNSTVQSDGIQKVYRCLVCCVETKTESVIDAWRRLKSLQTVSTDSPVIVQHYLEQSDRAPKRFVRQLPNEEDDSSQWLECFMQITNVSKPIPIFTAGTEESASLVDELWPSNGISMSRMPPNVRAVVEVDVFLITGRTHQIRGQLGELGFPIVGDEQYGGAVPSSEVDTYQGAHSSISPQLLALQCCELSFPEAEYKTVWSKKRRKDIIHGVPCGSRSRIQASLSQAWWTSKVEKHQSSSTPYDTIDQDLEEEANDRESFDASMPFETATVRPDLLPCAVQLAPGRNKYIMAKLRDPVSHKVRWFVKSAAPSDCGGPYHADVAKDLIEWIHSVLGYESVRVEVTGGGRIDYVPEAASSTFDGASSSANTGTVCVYGFSYRYGKGDHRRAADIIQDSMGEHAISVTYDLSDDLY